MTAGARPRSLSDDALVVVVGRLALAIGLIVAVVLPVGYSIHQYHHLAEYLDVVVEVKADAITKSLISTNPELWPYQVHRLDELMSAKPFSLESEAVTVRDAKDKVITKVGRSPDPPVMRRSRALYDSGREVGRVEVEHSLSGMYYATALAALLGLALGGAVFVTLRVLPLRALRRVTDALEKNAIRLNEALKVQARVIMERESAQHGLRDSEERYRKLFELSPDGMLILSEGRIVQVNGMCVTMLRASSPEDLVGKPFLDLFHPDYRERVGPPMAQMEDASLTVPAVERKILMLDGAVLDVEVATSPFEQNGEPSVQVIMRDITERKLSNDRLNHLAKFDSLTGLPNRSLLQDRLQHTLAHAKRTGQAAAMLFLDLDRFKIVNDTLGHAIGDELLLQVAARLGACIRGADTAGRFGGDEFGVILEDLARPGDAAVVARKINDSLARAFDLHGNKAFISASIGIALFPADAADPETLSRNADAAMYRAKELGRNNFQFFTPDMNARAMHRMQMEASMRLALERNEFVLHYQPKVDLASGAICGIEALLRWAPPEKELVSPVEFIPVLEESGLIIPVGEWVMREACRQTAAWQRAGLEAVPVAVNLSARQFHQKNLDGIVCGILAETCVDPALFQFEITESLLMRDPDEAARILHKLREAGVVLALDDFGTGYSSLAYLKRFPFHALKIDRAFINDIVTNPEDGAITLAIIRLAHGLKLKVVAEGVETETQANLLALHSCDEMQGYYFCRPVAAANLEAMLREGRRLTRSQTWERAAPAVLLLDDNANDLLVFRDALRGEAFEVLTATRAEDAFALLARQPVGIVVSDQPKSGISRAELLGKLRRLCPQAVCIDMRSGVDRPHAVEHLRGELREAYRRYRAATIENRAPVRPDPATAHVVHE